MSASGRRDDHSLHHYRHAALVAGTDFFVETDEGELWLLDLPWLMTGEVDRLLHHRVAVEGGRTGRSRISVNSIEAR